MKTETIDKLIELEKLITRYYISTIRVDAATDKVLNKQDVPELGNIMNDMYDAESDVFKAVGIDYHGMKL